MKAREIMTKDLECVTPDDSVARAAQLMRDADVGIIPVVEDRGSMRLAGLITDRDITVRHVAGDHGEDCRVRDHMTREGLDCVGPDMDVREVASLMKRDQVRRVPVVDEANCLLGIIAQADLAREGLAERRVGDMVEKISEPTHRSRR